MNTSVLILITGLGFQFLRGLLDPKLCIDYGTDRESGCGQPVKVGHTGERSPSYCPSVRGGVEGNVLEGPNDTVRIEYLN